MAMTKNSSVEAVVNPATPPAQAASCQAPAAMPSCSSWKGYLPRCSRTGEYNVWGAGCQLPRPDCFTGFAKAFPQNKEQKD